MKTELPDYPVGGPSPTLRTRILDAARSESPRSAPGRFPMPRILATAALFAMGLATMLPPTGATEEERSVRLVAGAKRLAEKVFEMVEERRER